VPKTADNCPQAKDDADLLHTMMGDMREAPEIYHPGNYWAVYERYVWPELQRLGLRDFRRRRDSLFGTFGGADLAPSTGSVSKKPGNTKLGFRKALARFALHFPVARKGMDQIASMMRGIGGFDLQRLFFSYAKWYGAARGAEPVEFLDDSLVGNPEDVFAIDNHMYTRTLLRYYLQYAYCCQFLSFSSIKTLMEVGSGAGRQAEVLRKLHPGLCLYLFDIPPQLYVCEQYLSAVFPDSIVGYRQTRNMRRLPDPEAGKIFIFSTWRLPQMEGLSWDLHWNATSYEEMEPRQALNFLRFVNERTKRYVYLQERMEGMVQAPEKGKHGVLSPTRLEHYRQGLPDFRMIDLADGPDQSEWGRYQCSMWERIC